MIHFIRTYGSWRLPLMIWVVPAMYFMEQQGAGELFLYTGVNFGTLSNLAQAQIAGLNRLPRGMVHARLYTALLAVGAFSSLCLMFWVAGGSPEKITVPLLIHLLILAWSIRRAALLHRNQSPMGRQGFGVHFAGGIQAGARRAALGVALVAAWTLIVFVPLDILVMRGTFGSAILMSFWLISFVVPTWTAQIARGHYNWRGQGNMRREALLVAIAGAGTSALAMQPLLALTATLFPEWFLHPASLSNAQLAIAGVSLLGFCMCILLSVPRRSTAYGIAFAPWLITVVWFHWTLTHVLSDPSIRNKADYTFAPTLTLAALALSLTYFLWTTRRGSDVLFRYVNA